MTHLVSRYRAIITAIGVLFVTVTNDEVTIEDNLQKTKVITQGVGGTVLRSRWVSHVIYRIEADRCSSRTHRIA
jgi:hypothetical protein